jgi:hypothetical protein
MITEEKTIFRFLKIEMESAARENLLKPNKKNINIL